MFGASWKWLKIPIDRDARGIVVRTLDHKYYLRPWTLRFIDPYVHVEFQTYMRRVQLERLRATCVLLLCICAYLISNADTRASDDESEYVRISPNAIIYGVFAAYLTVAIGTVAVIHSRYAYTINVPAANAAAMLVAGAVQIILLCSSFDAQVPHGVTSKQYHEVQHVRFASAYNMLYRGFPAGMLIFLAIASIVSVCTLDIVAWYVLALGASACLFYMMYSVHVTCSHDFSALGESYQIGLATSGVIKKILHAPPDATLFTTYADANVTELVAGMSGWGIHVVIGAVNQARSSALPPSVFDVASAIPFVLKQVAFGWLLMIASLTRVVYQHQLAMRTIFILTRVRSNKDAPRNLDGGIRLQELTEAHVGTEDRAIAANNLNANKKSSTDTDSSGNECVDERVKELELMATLEDLEMGERLSKLGTIEEANGGSAPNERAPSVASSGGLVAFAKALVPRTYAESDGKDVDASV